MIMIRPQLDALPSAPSWTTFHRCPEGYEPFMLAQLYKFQKPLIHIVPDDQSLEVAGNLLKFIDSDLPVLKLPAWDCLPYDRVSPRIDLMAERMATLAALKEASKPYIILTTASAFLQKLPPKSIFNDVLPQLNVGSRLNIESFAKMLTNIGFLRVDTVREQGEFAIRGGIIDLFPSGFEKPVRLDLFGDEIESLYSFDPITQRREEKVENISLTSASELTSDETHRRRFLNRYLQEFGDAARQDPTYVAIKEGRTAQGLEHLLPLFYESMLTLLDYVPGALVSLSHQVMEAFKTRSELIQDYYQARKVGLKMKEEVPYRALAPDQLYWPLEETLATLNTCAVIQFSPFQEESKGIDCGVRRILKPFHKMGGNLYDHFREELKTWRKPLCILTCYSEGSKTRLEALLKEHQISPLQSIDNFKQAEKIKPGTVSLTTLELPHGFIASHFVVVTEQDLLGDRLTRPHRKAKRSDLVIQEASSILPGDYVVHMDHGVGQFEGLVTIDAGGAPHDCLQVTYDQGDKLFVPVENLDVLSRFGSKEGVVHLDRLGGSAWQARKARVKERIKEIADKLLRIAAERQVRTADVFKPESGLYDEFSAGFPYVETEDQANAIQETLEDLAKGTPTDRLICGDVGFGKTEIALRAAFTVASSGKQVALVAPTTLLARQHFENFQQRFTKFGIKVEQLSRFVSSSQKEKVKEQLANGNIQIIVGTHALLAQSVKFHDLGLVIVDEEQHFGVAQKEKLKQLKSNVHVLTLTATPIPRTLQMALTGVRNMSIIATPPVDRLSVRTFVMPFDGVVIREAIMREHFRSGQVFYVCPRVSDLTKVYDELRQLVPEVKIATAHGQMPTRELENIMIQFYQGAYDILLSTNIIESGIDIPTANTLIVHRADMFGLSQLYQLRGRVGRSKQRGYAYLTLPQTGITDTALKRLEVMQTLDTLGAGFQLASYDMDIRGAGNLLGSEQSGHIREVGVELYQQMLEEAIHATKFEHGEVEKEAEEAWSPQINYGVPVLIPEDYVNSLPVRMSLYRRLSLLKSQDDIEAFAAELIDRFGPLPEETQNLLNVVYLKELCRSCNIEKLDAGEKGVVLHFRQGEFKSPAKLVQFIQSHMGKVRPDQSVFFPRAWRQLDLRQKGLIQLIREIAGLL